MAASGMLTGERRCASSRRGGSMAVLGKVAVPKPINLPSQRLENHGQDRDVKIVPKGTLSWGSKPSSSTSSAWGTSIQSPNADASTGSASHLGGRSSSVGSGTRPSSAGSDITQGSASASAWGPSSRPSSASGSLASNQQSLISLRPHSADIRPGSSQLSRISESVQRLESHGQGRDVDTVPKLGSKPSSSTSSAWGTSVQAPNTDGRAGSPSLLGGRPSSGGSGARPSTARSDIIHERGASAWDPSSRPSASESLTSNQQSLISLRPHSAETRLGSSQSSRFSESVAVPKPINLPSQRLERHGQHRDVEIVPKATLSWGSKPSSSTSSAWGTSVQSPNTDGNTGSPSNLEGCPSSGGSGTRPSSAGSDMTHERNASAWGPSSRPSSASGSFTSNQQSLISLRPHSAETRLGSSQLSQFAESVSDNTTAWGAGAADKLGATSSSGDFPTRGLDNESCGRNIENQADLGPQGRPGSSSGGGPPRKDDFGNSVGDFPLHGNTRSGNLNSWRRETQPYGDDGARPRIDKWHAEPQPYHNSGFPPQHYDAWHGPPANNHQGGVWYRGHPGGPPFRPGGFPYRPQVAPPTLANLQAVSGGGTGPRRPHPNNGNFYRPHMHDAFVRSGMTVRPGFYPGPVPCDSYYGPPLRNANPNEREISSMGMTVGPSAYNLFSGPNAPDMGNSNILGGYAPSSKAMALEQMESGRSHEARAYDAKSHDAHRIHETHTHDGRTHDAHTHGGQPKVLLKQYDCWEDRDEQQKRENINSHSLRPREVDWKRHSSTERSWNVDHKRDGEADGRKVIHGGGAPWELNEQRRLPVKTKSPASLRNLKGDVNSFRRTDNEELGAPQLPEVSASPRNPISLMQKIERLNAKVRVIDGLQDHKFLSGREEQKNNLHVGGSKTNSHGKGADSGLISHGTPKNHISPGDRTGESAVTSGTAIFRKSNQSMHGRADPHRLGTKEADGRHERSRVTNLSAGSMVDNGNFVTRGQDHTTVEARTEVVESSQDTVEGELSPPAADLSDTQLQRATMLELAKQRLQQREKEEEERATDQKAKALAKLEELNRRTQGEESAPKLENTSSTADQNEQEERLCSIQTAVEAVNARASGSDFLDLKPTSVVLGGKINPNRVEKSPRSSTEGLLGTPKMVRKGPVSVQEQSKNLHAKSDDSHHVDIPHIYDKRGVPQQKGTGNVQKQNMLWEKKAVDKLKSSPVASNTTLYFGGVAVEISSSGATGSLVSTAVLTETLEEHKNKSWGGNNKQKLDEISANLASASSVSEDKGKLPDAPAQESVVGSAQLRTLKDAVNIPSVQPNTGFKNANKSLEQRASSPNEQSHVRVHNQWKSLHSKRTSRNPTANRSTEKFHGADSVVWAPVRPQNKAAVFDEVGQKNIVDDASPSIKSDQQVQHSQRNKRTEMERYIPKQVSKEVVHGNRQAAVPLIDQASQDVKVGKSYSPKEDNFGGSEVGVTDTESSQTYLATTRKVVSLMESKNGDGKQSKPGKTYGPWCKRGPAESTGSSRWSHGENLLKLTEHPEPQGSDVIPGKDPQSVDEWNTSDDWNTPETPFAPAPALVVKVSGGTTRGKRQLYRGGHKGAGYRDSDDKRINGGDGGKGSSQSPAIELHQVESTATSKKRCVVGDQSVSHWQPKSHVPAINQQESRSNGTQNVVNEMSRSGGKELPAQSELENTATQQPSHEQSLSQEVSVIEHQETRRERRSTSEKGRLGKDQRGPGNDYRQNSASANRERFRNNPHFEYQPVGPQNNIKVNVQEPPIDDSQNSSSRFNERNHSHLRCGKRSGNVQVNASDK